VTHPLEVNYGIARSDPDLAKTIEKKPPYQVFKVIRPDTSETVGYIQLMDIDCDAAN